MNAMSHSEAIVFETVMSLPSVWTGVNDGTGRPLFEAYDILKNEPSSTFVIRRSANMRGRKGCGTVTSMAIIFHFEDGIIAATSVSLRPMEAIEAVWSQPPERGAAGAMNLSLPVDLTSTTGRYVTFLLDMLTGSLYIWSHWLGSPSSFCFVSGCVESKVQVCKAMEGWIAEGRAATKLKLGKLLLSGSPHSVRYVPYFVLVMHLPAVDVRRCFQSESR